MTDAYFDWKLRVKHLWTRIIYALGINLNLLKFGWSQSIRWHWCNMRMVTLRSIEIKDFSTSKWTSLLYLRWNPTMTLNIGTNLQCLARQVSNMWEIYLQIMLTFSDNQIILSEMCYNLKYCWEYQFQKAFFCCFF